MYLARFEMMKNKRYKCTDIFDNPVTGAAFYPLSKIIWIFVSIKPPIGFCKRPHNYL